MLMASCSKNATEPSPSDPDAWKTDITLPVPIEFGSPFLATKAGYIDAMQEKMNFGVFGISTTATDLTQDNADRLLFNHLATYTSEKGFNLAQRTFYPMTNDKNYSFYAYYKVAYSDEDPSINPYVEDKNKIYVPFEVGREDILYGSTKVTPAMENVVGRSGFNGGYIRAVRKIEEDTGQDFSSYKPTILFKHVTSAIQFYVRTSSERSQQVFIDENIWLTEIALEDRPIKANLCVVDMEDETNEGTFEVVDTPEAKGVQYVYVNGKNKLGVYPAYYEDERTMLPLGDPIFMVPTDEMLTGHIYLSETSLNPVPFYIDPAIMLDMNGNPIGEFKAGYRYNVTLVVHSPEKIEINVSVDSWKDGFTGGDATDTPGGFGVEIG